MEQKIQINGAINYYWIDYNISTDQAWLGSLGMSRLHRTSTYIHRSQDYERGKDRLNCCDPYTYHYPNLGAGGYDGNLRNSRFSNSHKRLINHHCF